VENIANELSGHDQFIDYQNIVKSRKFLREIDVKASLEKLFIMTLVGGLNGTSPRRQYFVVIFGSMFDAYYNDQYERSLEYVINNHDIRIQIHYCGQCPDVQLVTACLPRPV